MPKPENNWDGKSKEENALEGALNQLEKGSGSTEQETREKRELVSRATGALRQYVELEEKWENGGQPEEPEPLTPEGRIRRHAGVWLDGRRRDSLPIDAKLAEIHELLAKNRVVIVEAETGAGKTTRIPQFELLADHRARINMTQTRRNAVRWNGKRIAAEMGSAPGGVVGWRLFGEDPMVSRETRLTLTVDQSVTNRIRKNEGRLPKGILVVDEAHERSISTDLLLGLLKERLAESPETRVLVTSATIDTKKFSEFFGGAPVASIKGRVFPVSTETVALEKFEHHTQGAARAASTALERFMKGELATPTPDGKGTQNISGGTVVVLLPGKDDIRDVMRSIQAKAEQLKCEGNVEVLSCHGESTPEEQDRVQTPLKPGTLRFVCGTEVLRSSVTVQNTIGIIDSLQIKRLISDAKGVGHLDKIAVSKAEADQGKGRAGRTRPGFYMPVSFGSEYERLNPYPTPAILQQPITNVVLQVAAIDRSARDFAFIDKPPADKLETALTRLKRIGALDAEEKITEAGEMLVQFPLDPERAKVLLVAEKLGVLSEAVIAAGVLEAENVFFSPNREQKTCMVEETVMRKILSHVEKEERYGSEYWKKLYEPRDPATVDIAILPKWAKKKGEYWEVDISDYDFPIEDGVRGISNVVRKQWAGKDKSDFATIVRAYRAFKGEERRLRDAEPPREPGQQRESPTTWRRNMLQAWCERNFINQKRMREAERIMHEILDELDNSPLRTENRIAYNRDFNAESLTKALAAGLTDNVARKSGRGFTGPIVERGQDFQIGRESVCPDGSELVIVSGVRKIPTRRQSFFYLADLAAPIKKEWLKEVMPQLCTSRREADAAYSPDADAVLETEASFYADLDLGREKVPAPYTAENAQRFARWLAGYNAARDTKNEKLKAVLLANDMQQQRATNLNLRVGEAKLKQYSNEEVFAFYSEKLAGAWKQSEVENSDDLRLPPLEDAEVEKILALYPDKISILGSDAEVTYTQQSKRSETGEYANVMVARVNLGDLSEGNKWMQLPEEGVKLPSGFVAEIQVSIKRDGSYWSENFSNTDIVALKEKITGYLNRSLWEEWKERPEITAPNPEDDDAVLPAITTASYGTSVVDGTPLMAYGTVVFNSNRYYSTDPSFKTEWFSVRLEAEESHAKAGTELDSLKKERRDQRELKSAQEAAQQSKDRLNKLYDQYYYSEIDSEMRSKLYNRRYESLPYQASELKQWKAEIDATIAEVESAVVEANRKGEEENQLLLNSARPIVMPGETTNENTVYGMPCNEEGPCDADVATEWRLYSYQDRRLRPHKGYRSKSYGTTFAELIQDYLRDDPNLDAVLRQLTPEDYRRGEKIGETLKAVLDQDYASCIICKESWRWDAEELSNPQREPRISCSCMHEVSKWSPIIQAIENGLAGETVEVDGRTGSVLRRTTVDGKTAVETAVYFKYGHWNLAVIVNRSALAHPGVPETQDVWHQPTSAEIELAHTEREKDAVLSRLQSELSNYEYDLESANRSAEEGSVHKIQFRRGKNPKTNKEQWEADVKTADGISLKLILDSKDKTVPKDGVNYFCREYRRLVDNPKFKLIIVTPYLEEGRNIQAEIEETTTKFDSQIAMARVRVEEEKKQATEAKAEAATPDLATKLQSALGSRVEPKRNGTVTGPPPLPPKESFEKAKSVPEPEVMTPELQREFMEMLDVADVLVKRMVAEGLKLNDQQRDLLRSTRKGLEDLVGRPASIRGHIRTVLAAIESQYKKKGVEAGWTKRVLELWNAVNQVIADNPDAQEYVREGVVTQGALAEEVRKKILASTPLIQSGREIDVSNLLLEQMQEL
ncbi:MAG: ATP-dependent RNA helicase [Candidatus Liptonbacteria bacterium]|nr:ATP-dependent RNA helicase [Candidatus Liptonbacteria bacterium]